MSRRLKGGIAAGVGICLCFASAWWAGSRSLRRCGWLDDQITACERPFTAAEARAGRVTFEIVMEDVPGGGTNVRFAVMNNTSDERSLNWADVRIKDVRGRDPDLLLGG